MVSGWRVECDDDGEEKGDNCDGIRQLSSYTTYINCDDKSDWDNEWTRVLSLEEYSDLSPP